MKNILRLFCLKNFIMLGYPFFLMILEKSLRDLGIGETVEYMGVTLTAASVGFLVPAMFHDSNLRVTVNQIIDKIGNKVISAQDQNLIIGTIERRDKRNNLSNWAIFLFFLTLPAWFFTIIWSTTPDEVINWFGFPNSLFVSLPLYFPAAAISITNDTI